MNDAPKNREKAGLKERLGAALRENLKRRKAQVKARATARTQASAPHDSAGIIEDKQEG